MKRFLIAGVALITVLALTGCGATGYTTGRAQKNAGDAAGKVLENATGQKVDAANVYQYGIGTTGAAAEASRIDTTAFFGPTHPNTVFGEIGVVVAIMKDLSAASLVAHFTDLDKANEYNVLFRSISAVSYSPTMFEFKAQECDEDGNVMTGGAVINVYAASFGNGSFSLITTVQQNGANFTNGTPLSIPQTN
jgi:predicted small lipoprotein YifL